MKRALRWLGNDLGPIAVSSAAIFACVYGFALVVLACSQRSEALKRQELPKFPFGEVELRGVEINCDVARTLQPVLTEELENIKLQIRVLTEGDRDPNPAEEPVLIVLGHQWRALYELDNHLKSFTTEHGCNAV